MTQLQDAIDAAVDGQVQGVSISITEPENLTLTRDVVFYGCDISIDHITFDMAVVGTSPPLIRVTPEYGVTFDNCVFRRVGEWSKGEAFDEEEFNKVYERSVEK